MTRRRYRVAFVGGGNMASALVRGLLAAELYEPRQIVVTDVDATKRRALARKHRIDTTADNAEAVRRAAVVVLAVKPQMLPAVLAEIGPAAESRPLFVSIAAGFPLARLEAALGRGARLVRVMPNTPALLGRGMSVLVRGRRATAADEKLVLRMFRAVGDAVALRREAALDAVTGLSGSGPAYVYRFAEALIAAGAAQGLDPDVSSRLVLQTLEGSSAMLKESGMTPRELREMVSSPGGTTLAGLARLEAERFEATVAGAVAAATARSRELGAAAARMGERS